MNGTRPALPLQSVYLKPSTQLQRVILRSEANHFVFHWDAQAGHSRPCAGERCDWCVQGYRKLDKYLLGVESARGGLQLLEVRRAQFLSLAEFWDKHQTLVGVKCDVYKAGDLQNSKVVLEYRGFEEREPWDISKALDTIGAKVRGENS